MQTSQQPTLPFGEDKSTSSVGAFPVRNFLSAGLRKGTDGTRYLWPQMRRAYNEIRPRIIVAENVTGLLSMEDKSGIWKEVFPKVKIVKLPDLMTVTTTKQYTHDKVRCLSTQSSKTSKKTATKLCRLLYQLQLLEHRTGDTGFGLLATPNTMDHMSPKSEEMTHNHPSRPGRTRSGNLREPDSVQPSDAADSGCEQLQGREQHGSTGCERALEGKGGQSSRSVFDFWKDFPSQSLFVSEMMGFPTDYLVLPFQNGGSSQ